MIGKISKEEPGKIEFPKLMINENVIAIFSDATNALCVSRISDGAIPIGQRLSPGSFKASQFKDFHGSVEMSNI